MVENQERCEDDQLCTSRMILVEIVDRGTALLPVWHVSRSPLLRLNSSTTGTTLHLAQAVAMKQVDSILEDTSIQPTNSKYYCLPSHGNYYPTKIKRCFDPCQSVDCVHASAFPSTSSTSKIYSQRPASTCLAEKTTRKEKVPVCHARTPQQTKKKHDSTRVAARL